MSLPWFRMYAEFATDPVVQSLAFEDQRHYVVILCLKCSGVLDRRITAANRDRIILRALGLDSVAGDEAKRRLQEVNLVTKNWQPTAWSKRQYESDVSTGRVRKYRKSKETGNVSETLPRRFRNGPDTDTETDTETPPLTPPARGGSRFQKPTLEEVRAYIAERGSAVSAETWMDHYTANGFKVGKNPMKDWKAAVRTWERNGKDERQAGPDPFSGAL